MQAKPEHDGTGVKAAPGPPLRRAMQRLVVSAALGVAALCASAVSTPLQAQEETPIEYVANGLNFGSGSIYIGNPDNLFGAAFNVQRTQRFTTGNREGGYRLSKIRFHLLDNRPAYNRYYAFDLFEGPNQTAIVDEVDSFGDLGLSGAPNGSSWQELVPERETILKPGTAYHIRFRLRSGARAFVRLGNARNVQTGLNGWSTASGSFVLLGQNTQSEWTYRPDEAIAIQVFGTPALPDIEVPPVIRIDVSPDSIAENGGVATVTATADPAPRSDVSLQVAVTPGSTATSADYSLSSNTILTIAEGQTTSTGTVTVTPVNDEVRTRDRTLAVAVTTGADVDVSRAAASLTIEEDDAIPPAPAGVTAREAPDFVLLEWGLDTRAVAGNYAFQYQMKIGGGTWSAWADIPDSGPGGANSTSYKVTGLAYDTRYAFRLRAGESGRYSQAVEVGAETFTPFTVTLTSNGKFWDAHGADQKLRSNVQAEFSHDYHERNRMVFDDRHSPHVEYIDARRYATSMDRSNRKKYLFQMQANRHAITIGMTLKASSEPYRCTLAEAEQALKICSADLRPLSEDATIRLGGRRQLRLNLDTAAISENGGVAAVTASLHKLNHLMVNDRTGIRVYVDVAVESISAATEADYTLANSDATLKPNRLVIEPGASVSRNELTIAAVDNNVLERDKRLRISASTDAGHVLLQHPFKDIPEADPILTIEEDESGYGPPDDFRLLPALSAFVLNWDASPNSAREHNYQYKYKVGDGEYGEWTTIPDSGRGEANHESYTVAGMAQDTRHSFRLRAVDAENNATEETGAVDSTLRPYTAKFPKIHLPHHIAAGAEFKFMVSFDSPVRRPDMVAPGQGKIIVEGGTHTNSVHDVSPQSHPNYRDWFLSIQPDSDVSEVVVRLVPGTPPHTLCTEGEIDRICSAENHPLTEEASHRFFVAVAKTPVAPRITGFAQVGSALEANFDEARAGDIAYQWLRGSDEIADATASTYVPTAEDVGARLSVRVESGDESLTSAATAPVWPAPVNPPLADGEEELLSTTMTLGWHPFTFWVAGYGRVLEESFGEMDVTSFEDGDATYSIVAFLVNYQGRFVLSTGSTVPEASGLVAYWNGHRISGLETERADGGKLAVLAGNTPQPASEYWRYRNGASDGVRVAVSLRRTSVAAQDVLTAEFRDISVAAHDGSTPFTLDVRFSEAFAVSYLTMRDRAFAVTGGRVTGARRIDNPHHEADGMQPNREWRITVEPDGNGDVQVELPATTDCDAAGALCTAGGEALSTAVTATVPGEAETSQVSITPFSVRFEGVPEEHDGTADVTFQVMFNKQPAAGYSYRTMRDETLVITQGGQSLNAKRAKRLNKPNNDRWQITITPVSKSDIDVSIAAHSDCSATGAICATGNEALSSNVSATIPGPPGLSVADAEVEEAAGATADFSVTLGRASSATVTVAYATSDGTAVAGDDYTETSGTLTFAPGETAKTVSVPILQDAHDEGEETFSLTLSNPSGGNAWLEDAEATGTIENDDAMPQAWLARFGRTVAEQVIEAVEGRFSASRTAGVEMTLAGQRIGASGALPEAEEQEVPGSASGAGGSRLAAMKTWLQGTDDGEARRTGIRSVTPREILTGSSFALTGEAAAGGTVSLWGRGAVSRFDGREGDLSLDGEVVSAMLGADWARERWTAGLLVSRSVGDGGYRGPEVAGTVESSLTGLFPYGRYAASDRVTVWGIAGYGAGELVLTPEDGKAMRTDMDLAMGAVGLRGVAVEAGPEGGIELSIKTDAMAVRTTSDRTQGLAAAEADVTRLRLGLEGAWRGLTLGTGTLAPTAEIGVRHDGGDAETGFGLDLGGGLAWSDPESGLTAEFRGRGLLTHESKGFRDRGLSGSFAWDPGQGSGRGPTLTLTQTMGASAAGGADALLGQRHLGGLAANDNGGDGNDLANRRLELRMGYGFSAFGDRFTSTPELGLGLSNGRREYTLGWRLGLVGGGTNALELRIEGTRSEAAGANDNAPPEHGAGFRVTARW